MRDIRVVNEQILAFPTKLDVRVFALIVQNRTPLEWPIPIRCLFHMSNGGFHETHPIHHPIQIFIVIDFGSYPIRYRSFPPSFPLGDFGPI